MVEITTSMVQYPGKAVEITALECKPKHAGPHPAVIVVQEWWGLNDHIKDVAQRFAREGYVTLAPDLYSRLGHKITTDAQEAGQLMGSLKKEDGIEDLNSSMDYLKKQAGVKSDRVGVVGFCMGGSYALLLPCKNREIKAAVPFYGEVPDSEVLKGLGCPVLFFYGDQDGWIQLKDVNRLKEFLEKEKRPGEVIIYPGAGHAFFNDTRESYRAKEAQESWSKSLAFFKTHLQA
ncbi:MAG: dienelactone hydrolase family protein [Candidatus Binatia bacterium]